MPAIATSLALGLGGALLAGRGASAQARAAEQSSAAAIAEQRRQFDITQRNLQPWLTAGTQSLQMLQFLLGLGVPPGQAAQIAGNITPSGGGVGGGGGGGGTFDRLREFALTTDRQPTDFRDDMFDPSEISTTGGPAGGGTTATGPAGEFGSLLADPSQNFEADPGYAFRLQEGIKALERSAAARGTVLSGGTLRELTRYNQGFASNEFTNVVNRRRERQSDIFNRLAAIAGLGQTSATNLGRFGAANAESIGNLIVGGQTAAAAARASGYQNWANTLQGLPMNWLLLSRLSGGNPTAGRNLFSGGGV